MEHYNVYLFIFFTVVIVVTKRSTSHLYDRVQHRGMYVFCQSASCQRIFFADNDRQCSYNLCLFGELLNFIINLVNNVFINMV